MKLGIQTQVKVDDPEHGRFQLRPHYANDSYLCLTVHENRDHGNTGPHVNVTESTARAMRDMLNEWLDEKPNYYSVVEAATTLSRIDKIDIIRTLLKSLD